MYQCWIENEYGEKLELTNNPNYIVYQIDGLQPPNAIINTTKIASMDGTRFNSASANERNVVIYLTIEGDCETNRINLYKYVKTRKYVKFYYKNSSRDVYIDGYVESMQIAMFEIKQKMQISILCPQPYFKSINNSFIEFASVSAAFVFPFAYTAEGGPFSVMERGAMQTVSNAGEIENGIIINMKATGQALNPQVYNISTNEYFKLSVELAEGDEIIINTNKTQKSVILIHDGTRSNIINNMDIGSKWFQLLPGDNIFSADADEFPENIFCSITHVDEFEGV